MLIPLVAHAGHRWTADDLWAAWSVDPLVALGLLAAALLYVRGRNGSRRRGNPGADWRFALGLVAIAFALQSPLDALAGALASAHMVQHVLLVVVAAPLLAWSRPLATLTRGTPLPVRAAIGRWRRRLGLTRARLRPLSHPLTAFVLHASVLWVWHAAALYDAAVRHEPLHALEHGTLFASAALFWRVVVAPRGVGGRNPGERVLLVFAVAMQSVFLAVLLTFAPSPWYSSYRSTAPAWGLEPLADQQLAGVIMWVPAGLVYLAAALAVFAAWLAQTESAGSVARTPFRLGGTGPPEGGGARP